MGFAQIIPDVTFPSPIARVPFHDALESRGTVFDIYPGASWNPWSSIPASGGSVPNNAGTEAVPVKLNYTGGTRTLTAKRGLRMTNPGAGSIQGFQVPGLIDYLTAHSADTLLFYAWARALTAAPASDVASVLLGIRGGAFITNIRMLSGNTHVTDLQWTPANLGTVGLASLKARLTPPATSSGTVAHERVFYSENQVTDLIFYRATLINATVDGRTKTELDAAAAESYALAFAPGGVYAGDTWS